MSKKYPRTPHFRFSPGAKNDDRISDDYSNFIGKEVVITEKVDGSNTGFTKDGVYARSHATFTQNPWDVKARELHDMIGHFIPEDVYVFGEGTEAIHSIEYDKLTSIFYIFGVRENGLFLSWNEVEEYAFLLDLPTVPVLYKGIIESEEELEEIVVKMATQPSRLGGLSEGIVLRVIDSFVEEEFDKNVIKWVRKNHVQTDSHWTRNWRKQNINYER